MIAPACFPASSAPATARHAIEHGADAWLELPGASCGLWWTGVPPHADGPIGCIGAWSAGQRDDAARVLEAACKVLGQHGARRVVGPMDGNTWRNYRFVVESDGRPPFFLEPANPAEWVDDFTAAGFTPVSRYSSGAVDLRQPGPDLSGIRAKLEARGIRFVPMVPEEFGMELRDIHALSLRAFARNVFYTPLDFDAFARQYAMIQPRLVPELVWMARDAGGRLAAYLFAVPDFLNPGGRTVILKTLAADPEARYAGIGSVLTGIVHDQAGQLGFTTAIHALQHESNTVHRLSNRFSSRIFRRYALFGKSL